MASLDPYIYALNRLRSVTREYEWTESIDDAWKADLLVRLQQVLGLPNERPTATHIVRSDRVDLTDYVRETIRFESQVGLEVYGYLLTPSNSRQPCPAVICVPGHGEGVDTLVGLKPIDYQNQFALQCVKAGLITLAIEPIGFGRRQSSIDSNKGSSCVRDSMLAQMLGETMIGWRVWDAMASLSLLEEMPGVDSSRIGIMGISGGGLVALWAACLDSRFHSSVVSGYFNTFFDSILSIEHCVDNFAPGLAKVVEMPDLAALISPRRLFVESGSKDPIFPAPAFEYACKRASDIYTQERVPTHFDFELFEGDHQFWGRRAIPQLVEWLND